ncbi:MAG: helix-turn-helix domain-containing protein [Acidimicrobiales bacterium]
MRAIPKLDQEQQARTQAVPPLAVSARDAATFIGVGHDAIYALMRQGRLRSVRLGRRRLIPLTELNRFLAEELG